MENLLIRLARQLDSLDEASLLQLWSKYATLASRFEPTQRWEESVLIFSLIQAKHWKNQLFNYNLAKMSKPTDLNVRKEDLDFGFSLEPKFTPPPSPRCRVLSFKQGISGATEDETQDTPSGDEPKDPLA